MDDREALAASRPHGCSPPADGVARPASAPRPIPSNRFSVADLPAAQRHEAWANRQWPSLSPVYEATPVGEFDASSVTYALGDMKLWFTRITGQTYVRTPRAARTHGFDYLSLFMGWTGSSTGEAGDRCYRRSPGDLMLTDLAQPDRQHGHGGDCGAALVIPRALAETVLPPVEQLHGRVVPADKAGLLSALFRGLQGSLGDLDETAVPRVRRMLLDAIAVTLGDAAVAEPATGAAQGTALALGARREIEAGLKSASLSVASLCRRLGVSRSTLHRAFQHEGGIEAYIRNRRLAAVRDALRDPAEPRPIGELADRFGFSDGSHLSRLFRARYDMTPTEYRHGQAD